MLHTKQLKIKPGKYFNEFKIAIFPERVINYLCGANQFSTRPNGIQPGGPKNIHT